MFDYAYFVILSINDSSFQRFYIKLSFYIDLSWSQE